MQSENLQLTFNENSTSYIEITITNKNFARDKVLYQCKLIFLTVIYVLFIDRDRFIHLVFWTMLLFVAIRFANLIEKEDLKVIKDFGVEKSLTTFFRYQRAFIPKEIINKVVINEVIYFVSNLFVPLTSFYIIFIFLIEPDSVHDAGTNKYTL